MFGRKNSGGRKSPGRFMSGINDEVHGAHFDGDDIVLSEDLGGGRHRSVTIGGGIPETAPSEFRLVLGDFRVTSESGDPAVSVDTVPEALVQEILSSYKLSGVLSVYMPLKEDARMAVYRATGAEPLLYGDCLGFMARDFPN